MTTKKTTKKTATKKAATKATTAKKATVKKVEKAAVKTESSIEALRTTFLARIEDAQKLAKQTALAGLGAVDRSVEEVNNLRNSVDEQLADVTKKGTDLFNELVDRGNTVQADAEANIQENRVAFEKQFNERVDALKVKVAELSEQIGVADSLENVANALDSVSKRFNKNA